MIQLVDTPPHLDSFIGTTEYHMHPLISFMTDVPVLCTDGAKHISAEHGIDGNILMLGKAIQEHGMNESFLVCRYGFSADYPILEDNVFRIEDGNHNLLAKIDMDAFGTNMNLKAMRDDMWAVQSRDPSGKVVWVIMVPSEY